ncbi:MAG: glycosyltransferase family 2 protein [Pseudomonadota bacterium]
MTHHLAPFDDLKIISSTQPDPDAFTLCAIARNEMYFLPAFLAHYRKLGVEQFAILNDRSDDGTTEYLLAQPDVVMLSSNYAYGDTVELSETLEGLISRGRILYIWRSLLFDRFAKGRWGVQVDLDELIHLPEGTTFQDLARRLDAEQAQVAMGVMLDLYPADLATLAAQRDDKHLDPDTGWYFDGEPHLALLAASPPKMQHPGARARLYQTYGLTELYPKFGITTPMSRFRRMRKTRLGLRILPYNTVHKPVMAKWPDGALFSSSHNTNIAASTQVLLPMPHYRFTGALYRKIETAIRENSYSAGSRDHHLMAELLKRMGEKKGVFTYRKSLPLGDFDAFRKGGIALGL